MVFGMFLFLLTKCHKVITKDGLSLGGSHIADLGMCFCHERAQQDSFAWEEAKCIFISSLEVHHK